MNVLALDLSLTATGVAFPDGTPDTWAPACRGTERLDWFRHALTTTLLDHPVDLVALEGYAYGRPNQATAIGELGGVIKLALRDRSMAWVPIPPANLKMYATGRGNASKEEVLVAAVRRLGYEGHDDNEADALWLRAMTLHHYNDEPVVAMPVLCRKALEKVTWPEVAVAS